MGRAGFPAQFTEPYPRVDFIDARMWRPSHRRPPFQLFWLVLTKGGGFSAFQKLLRIDHAEHLDQLRHTTGPTGLMACAKAGPIVAMEVLIEEDSCHASDGRSEISPPRRIPDGVLWHP